MSKVRNSKKALSKLALGALVSQISLSGWGQSAQASVNTHGFSPTANPGYTFSEDALMPTLWGKKARSRLFFAAYYDYVNDPLVELNAAKNARTKTIVDSIHSLSLNFAYNIFENFQLGVATSLSTVTYPADSSQFGLTDSRLFGKVRLTPDQFPVALAVMPEVHMPTGRRSVHLSNGGFGAGIRLIAERDFGPVSVAANAGYRYIDKAQFRDLNMKSVIPLSLSALVPLGSRWAINGEASGELAMPFSNDITPSNFYAGVRYRTTKDLTLSLGGALGSINDYSSADYRIIAGLILMPQEREEPVVAPAPVAPAPVAKVEPPKPVEAPKPRVVFTKKEIMITEEIKFDHNKATLTQSGRDLLDEVARVMKANLNNFHHVVIEGHTNELGSHKYNMKLSQRRANAVREYLMGRGIAGNKMQAVGFGKTKPKVTAADGMDLEARLAANRRVEFKVIQANGKASAGTVGKKKGGAKAIKAKPAKKS